MGVPGKDAYGPDFDRSRLSLKSLPRVDSYRGFYFVSLNPRADDLVKYLAGAKDYLDPVPDQLEGGMKVIQGSNQCTVKANWKLMVEKSIDGYHIVPTHRTYLEYITSFGADDSGQTMLGNIPGRGERWATVTAWWKPLPSMAAPSHTGTPHLARRPGRK